MKKEWLETIREMRSAGYAVIICMTDDMGEADPQKVENCSGSSDNEYLMPKEKTDENE